MADDILQQVSVTVALANKEDSDGECKKSLETWKSVILELLAWLKSDLPMAASRDKKKVAEVCFAYITYASKLKKYINQLEMGGMLAGAPSTGDSHHTDTPEQLEDKLKVSTQVDLINVTMDDIFGLSDTKKRILAAVVDPIAHHEYFYKDRAPPAGVMLFGAPGVAKTTLAHAAATEAKKAAQANNKHCYFFSVSPAVFSSAWQAMPVKLVKAFFNMIRKNTPAIVFIDEMESFFSSRMEGGSENSFQMKGELLIQMNPNHPQNENIFFIGATNMPWMIDAGFARRFKKAFYIAMPTKEDRKEIFKLKLAKIRHSVTPSDEEFIASHTHGFTGDDLGRLIEEANQMPCSKIKAGEYFTQDQVPIQCRHWECQLWHPCLQSAPGAVQLRFTDIKPEDICEPHVSIHDFRAVLKTLEKTVDPEFLYKYIEFGKKVMNSMNIKEPLAKKPSQGYHQLQQQSTHKKTQV